MNHYRLLKPYITLTALLSLSLIDHALHAQPTGETWVRNTSPGPGHLATPGPWGEGQGSDRSEWASFFKTSPVNPNFMLQGTDLGRAYYTNTALGGTEFVPVDVPFYHTSTASFHPTDSQTAYILFIERETPGHGGWWRTTDEGVTWEQILFTGATRGGKCLLVVDPSNTNHLYVGTMADGLMRSVDNGQTWSTIAFAGQSILTLAMAHDGSSLYIIPGDQEWENPGSSNTTTRGGDSVWRIDNGDPSTLTQVLDTAAFPAGNFFDIDLHPADGAKGMIVCGDNLMFFSNSGATIDSDEYRGGNLSYARYNPSNASHLITIGRGGVDWFRVFQWSQDGGQTWNWWSKNDDWVTALVDYAPANWTSDNYHYARLNAKAGYTIDVMMGRHLVDFIAGDPDSVVMWATSWNKGPLRSDDYGANFTPFAHGGGFKFAAQMDYGLTDERIVVGRTEYGVQLTEDGGKSWKGYGVFNTAEFPTHVNGARAFEFKSCWGAAFDPTDDDIILASINYNPVWIMRSEDFGSTWSKVGEYIHSTTGSLYSDGRVLWSKADPDTVYVSTLRSDDGGQTFPTTLAHPVAAVHPNNAAVIVSKENANSWWLSSDYGVTWTQLPNSPWANDGLSRAINTTAHRNVALDPRSDYDPGLGNPLRMLIGGDGGVWEFLANDASGATGTWRLIPNSATVADPYITSLNDPQKNIWLGYVAFNPNPGFENQVYAMPGAPPANKDRGEALYQQLYRSTDYGETWSSVTDPIDFPGELPTTSGQEQAHLARQTGFLFRIIPECIRCSQTALT